MTTKEKPSTSFQEIKVKGNQLVDKIREIIDEGNARRVTIKKDGRTMLEFPLSVGVGSATAAIVFAPMLAAVGAFAALVSDVDVIIERTHKTPAELEIEDDDTPTDGAAS